MPVMVLPRVVMVVMSHVAVVRHGMVVMMVMAVMRMRIGRRRADSDEAEGGQRDKQFLHDRFLADGRLGGRPCARVEHLGYEIRVNSIYAVRNIPIWRSRRRVLCRSAHRGRSNRLTDEMA